MVLSIKEVNWNKSAHTGVDFFVLAQTQEIAILTAAIEAANYFFTQFSSQTIYCKMDDTNHFPACCKLSVSPQLNFFRTSSWYQYTYTRILHNHC